MAAILWGAPKQGQLFGRRGTCFQSGISDTSDTTQGATPEKGPPVKLEEQITKAVRITVLVCCGAILAFGTVFLLAERTMLFLDFSAAAAREGAFGSLVATAIVAIVVGIIVMIPKDAPAAPSAEEPMWKHTQGLQARLHRWYELNRVDASGRHYSSMPEGPFTGVVRTNTDAFLYLESKHLPRETVAWLIPDDSKFVNVTGAQFPPPSRTTFYLLDTVHGRRCCIRNSSVAWRSMEGRSRVYLDDDKEVSRWLELPDPEEKCTTQSKK